MKNKFFSARRIALLSVLTAMSLIMFMVESLFPPLFLPGAKMGLSNIFSLLALFVLGPTEAFILVVIRTTLGSVFTGNISTLMYSMTAGIVSVAVSALLVEFAYPKVSIVAISVVGAVMHNVAQNVVFCLISNTPEMFAYMPWLALIGVVAGIIVGFAVWFILKMVPAKVFIGVADLDSSDPPTIDMTPNADATADNDKTTADNGDETADNGETNSDDNDQMSPESDRGDEIAYNAADDNKKIVKTESPNDEKPDKS